MDVIPEQKTSGFVQGGVRMKSPRVWRQYQAILDKAEKRSVKMERVEQQEDRVMTCWEEEAKTRAAPHSHRP